MPSANAGGRKGVKPLCIQGKLSLIYHYADVSRLTLLMLEEVAEVVEVVVEVSYSECI